MNFIELATYVWQNTNKYSFGKLPYWEKELFTKKALLPLNIKSKPGLYWFLLKIDYKELSDLQKPILLPEKGCDFGELAKANKGIFNDLLIKRDKISKLLIIYNGHEKNLQSRIRSHYALQNDKTGSLGIIHYPLSNKQWEIRYFTEDEIKNNINEKDKQQIIKLLNSATGRCSIESAWRVKYGWPVLCKQ